MPRNRQAENESQTTTGLAMKIIGLALCLENSDCGDLELNKVYPIVEPEANDPESYLRIIDESEEDYIYPKEMFELVNLRAQIQDRVLENLAA